MAPLIVLVGSFALGRNDDSACGAILGFFNGCIKANLLGHAIMIA